MSELQSWEEDPALYLFTSLTAGSSRITTATSRIETILKNARIPFSYIDTATNESARKLYGRRGRNKKLPLLVKEGYVIADLQQVEEWNEFGELQENIGEVPTTSTSVTSTPAKPGFGSTTGSASGTPSKLAIGSPQSNASSPAAEREMAERQKETASIGSIKNNPFMRQLASEAAGKAKGRTFGAPRPTPLQDTTNIIPQSSTPTATAKSPSPPSETAEPTSPAAIASSPDVALPSPRSPSRQSSSSSRHASFVPEHPTPPVMQHRGSELSLASEDEIKEVEKATAIPEEDEGEDGGARLPSAASTSAKAAEDGSDAPKRDAVSSLDGTADDEPRVKDEPNFADLEKKLERVGTDLSLMESSHNVTSPTVTNASIKSEDHAATPAASSPIEKFEASLSRSGTDLSLLEEQHGIDAALVNENSLVREDHADTPAATSPIERFEASLSRSGTGLDQVESAHGLTSEDVLEEELKHETSIRELPASAAPAKGKLEESLSRTGKGLDAAEKAHGVDPEGTVEGEIKKEDHIPVHDVAGKVEAADVEGGHAKEGEEESEAVED